MTEKLKQLSTKAKIILLDNIMLFLLAKCEFDGWFLFFFQKTGIYKKDFPTVR